MRTEIKAILPELPQYTKVREFPYEERDLHVITLGDFKFWLDKLTEGAEKVYGKKYSDGVWSWDDKPSDDNTHTALLICPREIKKQTPLEIAVEYIAWAAEQFDSDDLREALAKIEAAK